MFDNLFSSSPTVWGGLIGAMVALPILIHLINLMRHKTVKWAAMEFLLKSHKKHRNWVWLKQMFLLLSRIAALLLALLMLAQIGCDETRVTRLLGGTTTHHYVLMDDSFSMSDRGSGGTAFDRARSTLSLIGSRAKNRQNQLFTILRYSMASPKGSSQAADSGDPGFENSSDPFMSQLADLNGELVDNLFDQRIEDIKSQLVVSNLSVGPRVSLETVSELIQQRENENAIVYVLSDFREKDWQNSSEIETAMLNIYSAGAGIELVNCTSTQRPNLAITELEASGSVRVAGTPLMMKVTVKNCSNTVAQKVQVKLASLAFPTPSDDTVAAEVRPDFLEIPTVFIQKIAPGESETRTFPVFFNTTGKHAVLATLPEDSVAADNERWNVTEFSNSAKVLMIDDSQQLHSSFLSLAISPNGMTGIEPEFHTKDYLRDVSAEELMRFDVLFLLDTDTLDESAIRNIETYAERGGGVAFFLGPRTNVNAYNTTLFRNGEGVFPIPLDRQFEVPELIEDRVPDFSPTQHPIFAPVFGAKNSLLDLVQIKRVIRPPIEWSPKTNGISVLATVRGNESLPLMVEKAFGKGRVIAVSTTAGPVWNNWTRNATFPPIILLMQDYLGAGKYVAENRLVGSSIEVEVPSNLYTPNTTTLMPGGANGSRLVNHPKLSISKANPDRLSGSIGKMIPTELRRETDLPGIYDVWLRQTDSTQEVRRVGLNVDTAESNMEMANQQKLLADLQDARPTMVQWDQFNPEPKQKPVSSLSKLLLLLLIGMLVTEQMLAYSTSYHKR